MITKLAVGLTCVILILAPVLQGCGGGGGGGGQPAFCPQCGLTPGNQYAIEFVRCSGALEEAIADANGCIEAALPSGCTCDEAVVFPLGPTGYTTIAYWYAQDSAMSHDVGTYDDTYAYGWSATPQVDNCGFLLYGPNTTYVPVGTYGAAWNLMIDNIYGDDSEQVILDVYDATTNTELAGRAVSRNEWTNTYDYESFVVPFTIDSSHAGHQLQFRVFWWGFAYMNVEGCAVVAPQ